MVRGEVPQLSEAKISRLLDGCTVIDAAVTRRAYVNVRRLFNAIAQGRSDRRRLSRARPPAAAGPGRQSVLH